jgi:hypothetical protein
MAYISVSNVVGQGKGDFGIFWQVGHKIVTGDLAPIYAEAPQADENSQAHPSLVFFWYPPHFAATCMPLGLMPFKTSMAVFKAAQTTALLFASLLFVSSLYTVSQMARPLLVTTLTAVTFIPMSLTISLCQPGIIIGFLPITAAYAALLRGRFLLAGMSLGVIVNKPQFLLPFALVGLACLLTKGRTDGRKENTFIGFNELLKVATGFAITAAAFAILGLSLFGLDGYLLWMQRLKSSVEFVYAHVGFTGYKEPYELISSLAMAIAFQCQQIPTAIVKSASSIFLLVAALGELYLLYRIASSSNSIRNKLDATMITALLSLPVVSPYFRIYDLSLVVLAAWIIFLGSPTGEKKTLTRIKVLTLIFLLFVDIRCLIIPLELAHKLTWINLVFVIAVTIYSLSVLLLLQPREKKVPDLLPGDQRGCGAGE